MRFAIRVDGAVLAEDLAHATRAGHAAISKALADCKRSGVPISWLKRCQQEHIDGTDLGGCVKLYIPQPAGPWGAVLTGDVDAGRPTLVLLAVGQRHPAQPWVPSVYEIAHRRLHSAGRR